MVCYLLLKKNLIIWYLGRIEFEEFAEIVADCYFKKFTRSEILEAFKRFDRNHDGFIEADELKHILSQLGRHLTNDEVCLFSKIVFFI
jgi:calmodulin